jgi:hypothetical protein
MDADADRRLDFKGIWIPIVCFLIALKCSDPDTRFAAWLRSAIGATPDETGRNALILFVTMGVGAAIGLAVIFVIAVFTWRRWPRSTTIGLIVPFVALCPQVVYSVAMVRRCLLVIDSQHADAIWRDKDLNIRSHDFGAHWALAIGAVLCIAAQFYEYRKNRAQKQQSTAEAPRE